MSKKDKPSPKLDWKIIVGALAIVAVFILIIMGRLTVKTINLFGVEMEVNASTASPGATSPAVTTATSTTPANDQPIATATTQSASSWNQILVARMPTLNEIRQDKLSIWDANNFSLADMSAPGVLSLDGTAQQNKEYLWPIYWCANSQETLQQNVANIQTIFTVNGEVVPAQYLFDYDYDTNTGWRCNYHATVISGWRPNTQYTLRVERIFASEINDGEKTYPAGSYVYELIISTK